MQQKIINILEQNGVISKEDQAIYCYGLDILISNLFLFGTLILLGLIMNKLLYTMTFIVLFTGIRRFTGGYHATKRWRCFCVTHFLHLIVLYMSMQEEIVLISLLGSIYAVLIIGSLPPVVGVNSLKDELQIKKDQYMSRLLTMMIIMITLIGMKISNQFKGLYITIIMTLIEVATLLLISHIQKRGDIK